MKVLPTFRPDKGVEINKATFVPFVKELEGVAKDHLHLMKNMKALEGRVKYFHENGCRISDHGLAEIPFATYDQ